MSDAREPMTPSRMELSRESIEALAAAIAARLTAPLQADSEANSDATPESGGLGGVSRRRALANAMGLFGAGAGAASLFRSARAKASAFGEENVTLAVIATNTMTTFKNIADVYRTTKEMAATWDKYVSDFNKFMETAERTRDEVRAFASIKDNPILQDARYLRDYVNSFLMLNDDAFKFRIKKLNWQSHAIVRFVDGFVGGMETIWDDARDLARQATKSHNPTEEQITQTAPGRVATRVGQSVSIAGQSEIQAVETRHNARKAYAQLQKEHEKNPGSTRSAGEVFTDNSGMMVVDLLGNISEQLSQMTYAINTQTLVLMKKNPPVGPDEGRINKAELEKSLEILKKGHKRRDRRDEPPISEGGVG